MDAACSFVLYETVGLLRTENASVFSEFTC